MKKPTAAMKNVTSRMPEAYVRHLKKRAREQRHYKCSEVVRRLVEADMSRPAN